MIRIVGGTQPAALAKHGNCGCVCGCYCGIQFEINMQSNGAYRMEWKNMGYYDDWL